MIAAEVARHIEAVAKILLGQPNADLSSKTEWRYGTHGSLAVNLKAGTFYDHEHGTGGGTLDLIGRELHYSHAEAMEWLKEQVGEAEEEEEGRPNGHGTNGTNGTARAGTKARIVATYDYVSERGELLFQVVRYEPKKFKQRRPDPTARDGWTWRVRGVEPVPYNLPAVLGAKLVVVAEGERKAERLAQLGFVATCNPGGAGKWPAHFAKWLAGKRVVVLPDHDAAGRKHAELVARNLAGAASAIKIVPLPGLAPKGDILNWADAGGTTAQLRDLIKAAPLWTSASASPAATVTDERPLVRVQLGELHRAVAEANQVLAERSPALFILGDTLVSLEQVDGGIQTVPATQNRIGLELARVARFERVARVTAEGHPEWRSCDPPMKLPAAIADEPGGWRSPMLTGLTEVPILRPNGLVVATPGYDPTSRLYLWGGPFAAVSRDPHAALTVLVDAVREFPFVEPHHKSAALALLLTSVSHRALLTSPMFGISAREAGTGKGALAQLAAIIATGRRAPETPWPVNSEDQRKAILAALQAGRPLLVLDNLTDTLESAPLCAMLTSETYSDRILGHSRMVTLPSNLLTIATGNNLRVAGDMVRRILPIELDAQMEHPELRQFERELVPWAIDNRQQLVAAAIGVLAAYRRAGSPLPDGFATLGSFEAWSQTICGALVWLGQPDPRTAMAANRASDPKRLLLSRVLCGIHDLFGDEYQSAGNIFGAARTSAERLPHLLEAVEEITVRARDDRAAKIALGKYLDGERGRVVGGFRLEAIRDEHRKVNLWRVGVCG